MNDTEFDELLRRQLTSDQPRLDDITFTKRVMTALPRRHHKGRTSFAVILTVTVLGAIVTLCLLPADNVVTGNLFQFLSTRSLSDFPVIPLALAIVSFIGAGIMLSEEN